MTKEELAAKMRDVAHRVVDLVVKDMDGSELPERAVEMACVYISAVVFGAMAEAISMPPKVVFATANLGIRDGAADLFAGIIVDSLERVRATREETAP